MSDQFNSLNLNAELIKNLEELKFESMTPVQEKSLPHVLDGKDVIAQAKTGSGKTAAFGLGLLNSLDLSRIRIQSLVLCPTRELAEQVAKEIRSLARLMKNVRVLTICGGASEYQQEKSLSHGAHIVVGTPGRVLRLLKKDSLRLNRISTLVLDEADRMLDMGFHKDIMDIIFFMPRVRQTLLFSATFPEEIKELSSDVQIDAVDIKVDSEHSEEIIAQTFFKLKSHQDKNSALSKILGKYRPERAIVFCKTKQITASVAKALIKMGISAEGIHGDLMQNERTSILTKFSNKSLSILVATDVAARGLDVSELDAVINYDLPGDPEVYTHRIGRTGRAGLSGQAFSLFISEEQYKIDEIEEKLSMKCDIGHVYDLGDEEYDLEPEMRTFYIAAGKKSKLRPGDILGALIGEAKIAASDVGDISILNVVSFVAVKREVFSQAIKKLNSGRIKNKRFRVGKA